MKLIVAADDKNGIAKDGNIPWTIPDDLRRFRNLTIGGTVIMGRTTWASLPEKLRPLPDRENIVVSRDRDFVDNLPRGVGYAMSMETVAVMVMQSIPRMGIFPLPSPWIIGGASIYDEALRLRLINEIHLTRVDGDFGCDLRWSGVPQGWNLHEADIRSTFRFEMWRPPA